MSFPTSILSRSDRGAPSVPAHRMTIGSNLRRLRLAKGWSQTKLSHASLVDPGYIGRVERAQINVSTDTLALLAQALGCEIAEFFLPVSR